LSLAIFLNVVQGDSPFPYFFFKYCYNYDGGRSIRQKPQAPTPQAPVRNRQTRKVANAKVRVG